MIKREIPNDVKEVINHRCSEKLDFASDKNLADKK